ncbi:MAG: hypothetical protein JSU95_09975 [Betaproteobacteria bacterium]|nr:MAG: hypothetical protein JSU95_09975 [Betaproteobacteria bacterium]
MIEKVTGISTVNFGVHAGLNLPYILDRSKRILRSGDVALLSIEYPLLHVGDRPSSVLVDYVAFYDPDYRWSRDFDEMARYFFGVDFLTAIFDTAKRWSGFQAGGILKVERLNHRGDQTGTTASEITPKMQARVAASEPLQIKPLDSVAVATALADLMNDARNKGVRVYAVWPNTLRFPDYESSAYRTYFQTVRAYLESFGVTVLGDPYSAMLSSQEMFDTAYHPNALGRERRTSRLLQDLCSVIRCSGEPAVAMAQW